MSFNYSLKKISPLLNRIDFSKVKSPEFELPNLKGIQIKAYENFLKSDLVSLIKAGFPVHSNSKNTKLLIEDVIFTPPEIDEKEALDKAKSYQYSIYLKVKLINQQTKTDSKFSEGKIFLGNMPALTKRANFIINGIEKFVISQIVRAPGVYIITKSQIKLLNSRKRTQEGIICELLPMKGVFILFNYNDAKDFIKVIARDSLGDNVPSFMATIFLKAFGLSHDTIREIFHGRSFIEKTLSQENFNFKDILKESKFNNALQDIASLKNLDKWLEDFKGTVDYKLNSLLVEYYQKHWEKTQSLINKLETYSIHENTKEALLVKEELENEISSAFELLNAISIEFAAKYLISELTFSSRIASYPVTSYQELVWAYFYEKQYYDIGLAGRYKLNYKLSLANRIFQKIIAQDIYDIDKNIVFPKNTLMTREKIIEFKRLSKERRLKLQKTRKVDFVPKNFPNYKKYSEITWEEVLIYQSTSLSSPVIKLIGTPQYEIENNVYISDFLAIMSYLSNLKLKIGNYDDIDHLENKRLRLISELLQGRIQLAMSRIQKFIVEKMNNLEVRVNYFSLKENSNDSAFSIYSIINTKPFQIVIKEFFNSHQLTQFLDQQNPLSELTNKRKISAMGPGGIKREDPNLSIRDVHYSHYGKICPIETPEGMNIGLIMSLASLAKVDKYGFLNSPYYKVKDGKITDEVEWLSAMNEDDYIFAEATVPKDKNNNLIGPVFSRYKDTIESTNPKHVNYIDVYCNQLFSISTSLIPFLEHDDANRALMGANMQRQAVPLLKPYAPVVGTGVENKIAKDSGFSLVAKSDGVVTSVDGKKITVKYDDNSSSEFDLYKFERSNQNTCKNQIPLVKPNSRISSQQILADGPAMQNGELALGQNLLVAFTTWQGYNYEDAIILSSRLIQEDVYTSIHVQEFIVECLRMKIGDEEITRQIPGVTDESKKYLDEDGVIMVGVEVKEGDILVGKTSPKVNTDQTSEEKLLQAIFSEKVRNVKDTSLRVPSGSGGVVSNIMRMSVHKGDKLNDDVIEIIKVFITQKRKIQVGDKMAGRHGNKGIVSKIALIEDMPYLEDGTPIDIMLNPLGVPSRMNIGQVLESHLGFALRKMVLKTLLNFYFKNDHETAGSIFGLHQSEIKVLFFVVGEYLKNKKLDNYQESVKTLREIDLSIILSRVGLKYDDLNIKVSTPIFSGVNNQDLINVMKDAGIDPSENKGKFVLYDGRTGEKFKKPIMVGIIYMLKLDHMIDDKIYARSVGPYSKITQQPLGGKCQNGGQRFGEMEVWALEAYGAAYNLRELLTLKSDDIKSRQMIYSAIIKQQKLPKPNIPESFKLLVKKLEGICLRVNVQYGEENKLISCSEFIERQLSHEIEKADSFKNLFPAKFKAKEI